MSVEPGLYRYYKNKDYEVLGIAKHSETLETLVVYKALYGEGGMWVRPVVMFEEKVLLNGEWVARFQRLKDGE